MKKNRCLWMVSMIFLGIVFFFTLNQVFLILDIVILLLPILSLGCNRQVAKKLQIDISNEQIVIKNYSRIGVPKLVITVRLNNFLTMEENKKYFSCCLEGKKEEILKFEIPTNHCGCIKIKIPDICFYDIWGVFPYHILSEKNMKINIWPVPFEQEIVIKESSLDDLDSMEYSTKKPGNDPGEMFDIKDYMPGDKLSSIHWKLSGKYDKLMVIRPGLPLENSILLLFETINIDGQMATPDEIHKAATIFFSISRNLLSMGRNHRVGWVDGYTGRFVVFDISSEDEFIGSMSKLLLAGYHKGKENVWMQYEQMYELEQNAHIVYVGHQSPQDIEYLEHENLITVLLSHYSQAELYYLEV